MGYVIRGWPDDDRWLFQPKIIRPERRAAAADIIEKSFNQPVVPRFAVELNNELLFSVSEDLEWKERKAESNWSGVT